METISTVQAWIATLNPENSLAVDDGGLTLAEVTSEGKATGAYYELGGIPAPIEDTTARHTTCKHCGQDIEGISPYVKGGWRDRGNNATCNDGKHQHAPAVADEPCFCDGHRHRRDNPKCPRNVAKAERCKHCGWTRAIGEATYGHCDSRCEFVPVD